MVLWMRFRHKARLELGSLGASAQNRSLIRSYAVNASTRRMGYKPENTSEYDLRYIPAKNFNESCDTLGAFL